MSAIEVGMGESRPQEMYTGLETGIVYFIIETQSRTTLYLMVIQN